MIVRSDVTSVAMAASKLFIKPNSFKDLATHVANMRPAIDLLNCLNFVTVPSPISWIESMARIVFLEAGASCTGIPESARDVYQKLLDEVTVDMTADPTTYTLERFNVFEDRMRTMFVNRKIDPNNLSLSDVSISAPISAQLFRGAKLPPSEKEELAMLRSLMRKENADLKAERPTSRAASRGAMLSGRG